MNSIKQEAIEPWGKEYEEAIMLAHKLLDEPYADPDDDIRTLARQFLRQIERTDYMYSQGVADERARCTKVVRDFYKQQDSNWLDVPAWSEAIATEIERGENE